MTLARVELYKDGDHMAVATNATSEADFWEAFCELLGGLIADDVGANGQAEPHYGSDWEFQLRNWLPQAAELVCKFRGYKAPEVHEERVLVAGYATPTHKVHEIGPAVQDGGSA